MNLTTSLKKQILELEKLITVLQNSKTYSDKLAILNHLPSVQQYLEEPSFIQVFLKNLTPETDYAIKSIIAIGQAPIVFNMKNTGEDRFKRLLQLVEQLLELENFYQCIGGIMGYHLTVLKLIKHQLVDSSGLDETCYLHPEGITLEHDLPEVRQAVRWGIENIPQIAMIYPLGGAGERLNLTDETTGLPLPVALLPFLGFSLLEGLIRELEAREYLFFKLFGKQPCTPIAIMTSVERNNHLHVLNMCKDHHWFGRPQDSFYFFTQPLAPVITMDGNWSLSAPLTLTRKPCGHGVIWKLAEEQGVFDWLESQGKHQALIRQINNPIAGIDNALLGLIGIGCHDHKAFGFVSCERLMNSEEGINVLIETQHSNTYDYRITNIEYTDLARYGIDENSAQPGSRFSTYPANTNILFADLSVIRQLLKNCPIPGKLVNMKSKVSYIDAEGYQSFVPGGRLESTMQNIADFIVTSFPHRLKKETYQQKLKTFLLYNSRSKTISTTKKAYKPGESLNSTPEQAYYDLLSNHYQLLQECQFKLPEWQTIDQDLLKGPSCIFLFHPGLGPLYSIIAQKIRKGSFAQGAELQLEIAEIDIENLSLEGSLLIKTSHPLGFYTDGILQYGQESRCTLKNVTICNQGINRKATHHYWKNTLVRHEDVTIILHEGAEFHAENISLQGSYHFEIPAHHCLTLLPTTDGKWKKELFPIQKPTWKWHYSFDDDNRIQLEFHDFSKLRL